MLVVPYLQVCVVDTFAGCCIYIQFEFSNIPLFAEGQAGYARYVCDVVT